MPSWTRAPPESLMKMKGVPFTRDMCIAAANLDRVHLPRRATGNREVLAGQMNQAAKHGAGAGDLPVPPA